MEYFQTTVLQLGSHFDGFIFEGEAGDAGKKLVEEYKKERVDFSKA